MPPRAAFVVSLSSTPGAEVKVSYATMPALGSATSGTDYTPTTGTLTFAAGTTTLDQTVNVAVVGDTADESDEDFFVQLYNPTGGSTLYDRWGRGVIVDDDAAPPVLTVADAEAVPEGNAAADDRSLSFNVTLSATPAAAVTVRYATQYGTASRRQRLRLPGVVAHLRRRHRHPDPVHRGAHRGGHHPRGRRDPVRPPLRRQRGHHRRRLRTGVDPQRRRRPPVLSIAAASVAEGRPADGVTLSLPVTLSATPTTDVVVRFATMGAYYDSTATSGTDYPATTGTLTFPAGTATLTQQVTVAVVEDTWSSPTSGSTSRSTTPPAPPSTPPPATARPPSPTTTDGEPFRCCESIRRRRGTGSGDRADARRASSVSRVAPRASARAT